VKFSEFEKKQRLLGLRRVALDNGIQFGSLFSERLITDILWDLKVPASRCNYARVYLNGDFQGVYVNVERIDESFLESRFGDDSGPLFKVDKGGPGADLQYLGGDPNAYRSVFELDSKKADRPYERLVEFIRTINQPPSEQATQFLGEVFQVDAFMKTMAVMLFAGAFDQYTGWSPHNYYLYQNPADRCWVYVPWDLDVGFADNAFSRVQVLRGWHAAWPAPLPGRPLLEQVISNPALLSRYRQVAAEILEKYFQPEILIPKLRKLHAQIQKDLHNDPFPPRRATNPGDKGYDDILASMEDFIRHRYELARAQLANPGPRPEFSAPRNEESGPAPGPASADAPSNLRIVHREPGSVELQWQDNAEGEQAFIIQRCLDVPGAEFQNVIGLPGQNITSAIDRDVRPGVTYRYRVFAVRPTPAGAKGTGPSSVAVASIPREPVGPEKQ
jgi:hypothetical protein